MVQEIMKSKTKYNTTAKFKAKEGIKLSRIPKSSSAEVMLEVLSKQWLDTNDIKILACVGIEKARKIKYDIASMLEEDNYFLPNGLVPSEKVIEYLNININYLKKIARNKG